MKKVFILILCTCLLSCVFESRHDLKVKIINNSKSKLYVGEAFYDCDSCGIKSDIKLYCTHGNDTTYFPKVLNAGDSTIMLTKLQNIQKINVLNVDSLEKYCNKKAEYNIQNKSWVKIITESVNMQTKSCTFIIR